MFVSRETFTPHDYQQLAAIRAFPEGAMPEAAYRKICSEYASVEDVSVERIIYSHDGLQITGLLAAPSSGMAPKGLVIYNRGGSGNYGILTVHAAMRQFVPLARAGYLVVGSNYRGNDGGDGQDEFGGRDVGDVMALYELVKEEHRPPFIVGHSRGCMMNYLLLKKGLKARAVVSIAGVAELRNWNQFRSEMRERVYKRFIPDFEAHEAESLAERSAICWPDHISAPLLLLHGTKDDRVQHEQSEMLADALERLGKPYKLVHYEGGNHALTRHWDAVMNETLEWLARYDS